MDDDEDFRALFFQEARELLEQLLEHLNALANDDANSDTVHAAFRAVHSVKGGAAAFGFDTLIAFAHIFETVMDKVRDETLDLSDELMQVLLRSGDVMQVLVENAEAEKDDQEVAGLTRLHEELHHIAEAAGAEGLGPAPSAAAAAEPVAEAAAEAPASDVEDDADPAPVLREITVRIAPDEAFFDSGHDMLRLIRSARERGLAEVHVDGSVPSLADFDPRVCPLTWELVFRTDATADELTGFFVVYEHTALIELLDDEDDPEGDDGDGDGDGGGQSEESAASTGGKASVDDAKAGAGSDSAENSNAPAASAAAPKASAAQPAAENKRPPAGGGKQGEMSKSLRVEIARIDRLVNLVGEMLITQAGLAQQIGEDDGADANDMALAIDTMSRQLRELQESVMAIRAQPVKSVFRRMPRVVRDLADKLDKQAKLELAGEYTEVDATVIEELAEPLTHMIRNAMDHGLEDNDEREKIGKSRAGTIKLSAEHRGERVIITVQDDGRGVNRERVMQKALERGLVTPEEQMTPEEIDMLIFHPGFSTAEEVSSVSGRGVGMDVVKKKILALGGRFAMVSTPGHGTKFTITLPLTLAVMDGMTIGVGEQKYILPLSTVVEALYVSREGGKTLPDGTSLLERRGEYLKLISLRDALALPPRQVDNEMAIVVDTETQGHVALTVDELIGQRQIVLKSLEANFHKIDGISGATILGDGQVALILDVPALIDQRSMAA